ncbi:MAG: acyl-ACP--UDP-N-acetylglucosamine O-acyltransferase [Victivallaceae bacterium]
MNKIHPTAVIAPGVELGDNIEIGPYVVIEHDVKIGDGCYLDTSVQIGHHTTVGERCRIYHGALVGIDPQDHRFNPDTPASTEIGSDTVIREYVTIHRSPFENGKTIVGNHVLLMAFVHIGHDCRIADHVTIANSTGVSGHVEIGFGAVLSGYILIHQFSRIGEMAMVAARTNIVQDIPPYCLLGESGYVCGANVVGMRRNNIASADRTAIRHAIRVYFYSGLNGSNALREIMDGEPNEYVRKFVDFIKAGKRGIMPGDPNMLHRRDDEE